MMRNFTKSVGSFSWAMSIFGAQQVANMLRGRNDLSEAADSLTQSAAEQIGEMPLALFLLGDSIQREATDMSFGLMTRAAVNPNRDTISDAMEQTMDTFRGLNPVQGGTLTLQELRNKIEVFQLVRQVPKKLNLSDEPPYSSLSTVLDDAYKLGEYEALWAVEGTGHWYGDNALEEQENPRGILQGDKLSGVSEKSLTMLNAGIGMAFAQHWMKKVNHLSPASAVRETLEKIIELCENNATQGYKGAALESLGLITQNGQFYSETRPAKMVQIIAKELKTIGKEEAFEYFWRGVGRAHYFLPIHFLPGYGSIAHAVQMIRQATDEEKTGGDQTAWLNAVAGLAWGVAMVNICHPKILANYLKNHSDDVTGDNGLANGVASAIMMRQDTTPDASFIKEFYEHDPGSSDPDLARNWNSQVKEPCREALREGGYYGQLKTNKNLGEIFRYHESFSEIT
jgi:hypothetical protein